MAACLAGCNQDDVVRNQLMGEIADAFTADASKSALSPELVRGYEELVGKRTNAQNAWDALRRELFEQFPELRTRSEHALITDSKVVARGGKKKREAIDGADKALEDYLKSSNVFQGYVEAMKRDGFWLGIQSLLAYAKTALPEVSIVIVKPKDETSKSLIEGARSQPSAVGIQEIHLLYVGGSHFDLLRRIDDQAPST